MSVLHVLRCDPISIGGHRAARNFALPWAAAGALLFQPLSFEKQLQPAWLWGVPGALMAVPLLAVVKIICERIEPLSAFAEFIGH